MVRLPLWSVCRQNKNDFVYLLLFAMTVPLHKFKQPKPKHMSASDGNVHFHVVCIAFSFSAALFSPAGLSLRHLFFFFFLRHCRTRIRRRYWEWSASLWSRYRLRETQQQEKGLYSGLVSPLNSPGALRIPDGAEKLRRKSRMWKLGWRKKGPRRGKATSRITKASSLE